MNVYKALLTAFALLTTHVAVAQETPDTATGLSPYATYISSDIDNVNPLNGNLFLKIPLVSFPQVGSKLRLDYSIYYNDKAWSLKPSKAPETPGFQYNWQPGISNSYSLIAPAINSGGALGYTDTLGAYVTRDQYAEYSSDGAGYLFTPPPGSEPGLGPPAVSASSFTTIIYALTPDGSRHTVGDKVNQYVSATVPGLPITTFSAGNSYPATDASGFDQYGHDANGVRYSNPNLPNILTPVAPNNGGVVSVIDPNGNAIVPNSSGLTDSYGRNIPGTQGGPGFLTFPNYQGNAVLSPGNYVSHDIIPGLPSASVPSQCPTGTSAARQWVVPASESYNSGSAVYYLCYTYTSYQTNFNAVATLSSATGVSIPAGTYSIEESNSSGPQGQALMLTAVVLPDGNFYTFQYDSYLSLKQLGLPSGAIISYTWQTVVFGPEITQMSRALQSRTVNPGNGQPSLTTKYQWHFQYSASQTLYPSYSVITDSYGNDTEYTLGGTDDLGNNWQGDLMTAASSYAGCSPHDTACTSGAGTLMKSVTYGLTGYSSNANGSLGQQSKPQLTKVTQTTTHIPSAAGMQLSRVISPLVPNYGTCTVQNYIIEGFENGELFIQPPGDFTTTNSNCYTTGQIASTATYDFGSPGSGAVGPLLKTATTNYAWQSVPSILAANMLDLTGSVVTTDSNGSWASESDMCYDAYGNETSSQRFLGQPSSHSCTTPPPNALVSSTGYTSQGVVQWRTDANGNSTGITAFACNGALPQNVTMSNLTQTAYTYDCNTGKMTGSQDQNDINAGTSTVYTYADPLSRLTAVAYPDGGSMSVNYNGDALPLTMQIVTATGESAGPMVTTKVYDGLARDILTQQEFSGSGSATYNVSVATNYDALGRVANVSNPYVTTSDPTYGVTSYSYDALGRKLYQCQPDNTSPSSPSCSPGKSYQKWTYSGNASTFMDEIGNQWQRTSDALGRPTMVLEPNGANAAPSMETDYTYNALDDLVSVTQYGGPRGSANPIARSFTYDSLSRLITSTNPETGQICYGLWGSGNCQGGYDRNGNLLYRTDARGVWTHYTYDNLNRILSKTYSDPLTPSVSYTYDTFNSYSVPYGIGRLTSETAMDGSTLISRRLPTKYDSMGRIKSMTECTVANCSQTPYQVSYSYDLAGNPISSTNGIPGSTFNGVSVPSITLSMGYDVASHPNSVTSSWSDTSAHPATLFQANNSNASSLAYAPSGALQNAVFGVFANSTQSTVSLARTYDNRLRTLSETDTANNLSIPANPSSGSITIGGSEQSLPPSGPHVGSATVVIAGSEQNKAVNPSISSQVTGCGSVTTTSSTTGTCYDGGSGTLVIASSNASGQQLSSTSIPWSYSSSTSTSTSIASSIISTINANSSSTGISATATDEGASGSATLTIGNPNGTAGGFALFVGSPTEVNQESPMVAVSYSATATAGSIASQIVSSLGPCGTSPGQLVGAISPSSGTVTLTSCGQGAASNYTYRAVGSLFPSGPYYGTFSGGTNGTGSLAGTPSSGTLTIVQTGVPAPGTFFISVSSPQASGAPIATVSYNATSTPSSIAAAAATTIGVCGASPGMLVGASASGATLTLTSCAIGGSSTNYNFGANFEGAPPLPFTAVASGPALTGGVAPQAGAGIALTINGTSTSASSFSVTGTSVCGGAFPICSFTQTTPGTLPSSQVTGSSPTYDSGVAYATIDGVNVTYPYGSASRQASVATGLAAAINGNATLGPLVRASATGNAINLTSVGTGSSTDWAVSAGAVSTNSAFTGSSFTASSVGMSGGSSATPQQGVAYSYSIPQGVGVGYAANGNLLRATDSVTGSWGYGYDTLNRLSTAAGNSGTYNGAFAITGASLGWSYDGFGNRKQQTSTSPNLPTAWANFTPANNRMTTSSAALAGVQYDLAGDVTYDGRNNYAYDAEGRICALWNGAAYEQYLYDGDGNRVAKGTINSLSCNMAANGFSLTKSYIHGAGGELLTEMNANGAWSYSNVYVVGRLIATYRDTNTYFDLNDWLGTKRVEISSAGCQSSFSSLPFGDGLTSSGNCPDASEQHFTGKERDAESGLDYFGARYYASNMGRWMSPDWSAKQEPVPYSKLDDPQTLNLYGYVGNNPLSRADADGHCWWQAACDAAQKAFGTASQLLNDGLQRVGYTNAASQLSGPGASAERKALQVATRAKLSPIGGAITDAAKASRASQLAGKTAEQLVESASRTNAGVNALGTASTAVGAAGVALGVGAVALDTVNAPAGQKLDAAMNGGARLGGSALGAEIGGAVGALGGPIGAVVGSLLGGAGGQQIVTTIQNAPPMDPQTQLELGGVP